MGFGNFWFSTLDMCSAVFTPQNKMAESKLKLFLNTLSKATYAVNPAYITEDAEKQLRLLLEDRHVSSKHAQLLGDLENIIKLSKSENSFKSAKKRAETVEVKWRDFEASLDLEKILAQQSSGNTRESVTHHGPSAHKEKGDVVDYDNDELLEKSRIAGAALVHDNPDITDLSDPNRPTKIAERFSELYDNEWTDAFDEQVRTRQGDEKNIISDLLAVVKSAYEFCTDEAGKQIKNKSAEAVDDRNHYRKAEAHKAITGIQKGFLQKSQAKLVKHGPKTILMAFTNKCVELCWWMSLQERPVYMCTTDEEQFNPDFYRAYTRSGAHLDYYVWPALRLYKNGPLLDRGVAQFKG